MNNAVPIIQYRKLNILDEKCYSVYMVLKAKMKKFICFLMPVWHRWMGQCTSSNYFSAVLFKTGALTLPSMGMFVQERGCNQEHSDFFHPSIRRLHATCTDSGYTTACHLLQFVSRRNDGGQWNFVAYRPIGYSLQTESHLSTREKEGYGSHTEEIKY